MIDKSTVSLEDIQGALNTYDMTEAETGLTSTDLQDAVAIIAAQFDGKLKHFEAPHNVAFYATWALKNLLERFDLHRRA